MSAKTKIIVLHAKELVFAGILAAAGLFFILLMILLLFPRNHEKETAGLEPKQKQEYLPGVYKSELWLGGRCVEVETILDANRITSVRLTNLDEAITTAYPLLEPTMESVCRQVCETQSLDDVRMESSARYTTLALLAALENCLEKGRNALTVSSPQ